MKFQLIIGLVFMLCTFGFIEALWGIFFVVFFLFFSFDSSLILDYLNPGLSGGYGGYDPSRKGITRWGRSLDKLKKRSN